MMEHELPLGGQAEAPEPQDDVTLGMGALLGIFLAVVVVCALFFGFGYSTGRTLHTGGAQGASSGPGQQAAQLSALPATEAPAERKPSPAIALTEAPPSSIDAQAAVAAAPTERTGPTGSDSAAAWPPDQAPAAAPAIAVHSSAASAVVQQRATPPPAAAPLPRAAAGPVSSAGAGLMVQIAAVARQGDADALARALRSNGYPALVRTEARDSFLHVQVGPFATREQARAMRARLAADGYNAFIKP